MARTPATIAFTADTLDAIEKVRTAAYRIRLGNERTRARLYLALLVDQAYRDLGLPPPA